MEQEIVDVEAQVGATNNNNSEGVPIFSEANRPVTLKFQDLVYKIKPKSGSQNPLQKGKKAQSQERIILKNVTGIVKPGEMLAMLGPSGSGKTTLLTALGGRLTSGHLEGTISYNNKPFSNATKRNTGFVTQDDVLYPHLTVTETLVYTALLRLPKTYTKLQKIANAESVIFRLGLTTCRNNIIGDSLIRGISGGERKRVSIGQEMLINPSLLFLDEPTSGLDSTTAQRIVSTLWELANAGRTIVMTIHQPSSRLFYMFHKVLLLSDGNPLYFGEGRAAMEYFASVGYEPKVAMNPSDFLLDLANGISPDDSENDPVGLKESLISTYTAHLADNLKAELKETGLHFHERDPKDKEFGKWPTTWWQQFTVLFKRGIKERKYQSFSGLKIGQVLVVAVIAGLLWWQSNVAHLQDQIGLLFFTSGFWGFYPLFQAIFTFPQERVMLEKERSSGMYRLSSYFMSRIVADLPMELVLPTAFVIITYWMAGLKATLGHFLHTLFVILYSVLVAQGLGLALGALVMDQKSATILGSVIMLTFLLAGGYYVQHVPSFISWIKYISISYYSYKLLMGSQYKPSDTYPCGNGGGACLVGDFPTIKKVGLEGQVIAAVALGIMLVGYRLIAYMALTRIGVTKKMK